MYSRMIRKLVNSEGTEDLRYIHALLMDPHFGLVGNRMPQVLDLFPKHLKASGEAPDTLTLSAALAGAHRVAFLEAMQLEKEKNRSNMAHGQWYQ
jgi:hypothetical protein